ncbi:MAG: biopolymer transporter ExbD [Planctomycetota bacterium]
MARKSKKKLNQPDIDLDLTPMIDIIFLLIIFFILAGKISSEITNEKITVPPSETAEKKIDPEAGWKRIRVEVWGNTQEQTEGVTTVMHQIKLGLQEWKGFGYEDEAAFAAYSGLREALDQVYSRADKYTDPKTKTLELPKVIVELRADGDCEYRVVQEIQQILSDTITPDDGKGGHMVPNPNPKAPFVNIEFTTRAPGDKTN